MLVNAPYAASPGSTQHLSNHTAIEAPTLCLPMFSTAPRHKQEASFLGSGGWRCILQIHDYDPRDDRLSAGRLRARTIRAQKARRVHRRHHSKSERCGLHITVFYSYTCSSPLMHSTTCMFDFDFRPNCEHPASRALANTTARKAAVPQGRCAGWDYSRSSSADNYAIGSFSVHTRLVPSARTVVSQRTGDATAARHTIDSYICRQWTLCLHSFSLRVFCRAYSSTPRWTVASSTTMNPHRRPTSRLQTTCYSG